MRSLRAHTKIDEALKYLVILLDDAQVVQELDPRYLIDLMRARGVLASLEAVAGAGGY